MPGKEFNIKDALLLINEYTEDFPASTHLNSYQASLQHQEYNASKLFPKFASDPKYDNIKALLKEAFYELDEHKKNDVGWQKARNIFSPDIDTQVLAGDYMQSSSYMHPTIPTDFDENEE